MEPRRIEDIQREIYRQLAVNGSYLTDATPGSVLYSLTRSFAGVALLGDQLLAEVSKDFFLATASGKGLDDRVAEYGVFRKRGTAAYGTVLVRSREGSLTLYPGTVFTEPISGIQLISTLEEQVTAAEEVEVRIAVVARKPGRQGNLPPGVVLHNGVSPSLEAVVGGTRNLQGNVIGGLIGGEDEESDEALRQRAITKFMTRESCTEEALLNMAYSDNRVKWATAHLAYPGHTQIWVDLSVEDKNPVLNDLSAALNLIRPVGTSLSVHSAQLQLVPFELSFQKLNETDVSLATEQIETAVWLFCLRLSYGQPLERANLSYTLKQIPNVRFIKVIQPASNLTPDPFSVFRPSHIQINYDVY